MNKMDDFFNKRLSDFNTSEEGWNVPSDQVWENVKDHLPKPEKKKRRFIFFFLFGVLLLATIYTTAAYFDSSRINDSRPELFATEDQDFNKKAKDNDQTISELSSNKSTVKSSPVGTNDITKIAEGELIPHNRDQLRAAHQSRTAIGASDLERVGKESTTSQSRYNSSTINRETQYSSNVNKGTAYSESNVQSTATLLSEEFISEHNKTLNSFQEEKILSFENSKTELRVLYNSGNIALLSFLPFKTFMTDRSVLSPNSILTSEIPVDKLIPVEDMERELQEIGISHSLSAFTFLKSQTVIEEMDRYTVQANFKNINLEYGRWISNRWKFSTGLYLSKIDINLGFYQFFNFDQSLMTQSIETEYGNTLEESGASGAGNIRVSFIEGLEPSEGELLNIRGDVDVSLGVLQIPLFLSHHRRRKKMEFFAGGGITLELVREQQKNGVLDVFREDQIISSSSEIDDLNELRPEYSIYGIAGFRYNLSAQINTGINLKVNVAEPIFSTADVGIYYRL